MALRRHRSKGLIGSLQDSLGSYVDPRSGGHLAEHREPQFVQPAELLPGRPLRYQVGVRDEDPRRPLVGPEDAHRLAGLDEKRLLGPELSQARDDRVISSPAARRLASAPVDDQLVGMLGDIGVEVVHQHAHRRFLRPAFARELAAVRCTHGARSTSHRVTVRADSTGLAAALEAGGSTSTPMCKT